jgi:hypothetical protein
LHFYVAASEDPWGTTVFEKEQWQQTAKGEKSQLQSVGATTTRSAGNNTSCKKKTKFSKT